MSKRLVSLRLGDDAYAALVSVAALEHRSLSAEVEVLVLREAARCGVPGVRRHMAGLMGREDGDAV